MHKLDDKQNPHINNRVHQHSRKIQQYANSFKYLSRHNIQLFNKTIVQNLDDYIKRQLYHIRLLISNYTLNTKSDTLLECTTNNISIYIYINIWCTRRGEVEVVGSSQHTHVNESFMDTTLITGSQKIYIRIDLKCMHLFNHSYSSINMHNSFN